MSNVFFYSTEIKHKNQRQQFVFARLLVRSAVAATIFEIRKLIKNTCTVLARAVLYRIAVRDTTTCLLYTSPSPRDRQKARMPSSA